MPATDEPIDDATEVAPDDVEVVDGRAARRDRNRTAVLEAVVDLFSEEDLEPAPDAVAARSGVSLRSVYRYFDDREALLGAAIEHKVEQVRPLLRIHDFGRGSRAERIDRLVAARLQAYDEIASTHRAARRLAVTSVVVREGQQRTRVALRHQVEVQLAPELAALRGQAPGQADVVLEAVDALLQLETLDLYRLRRGLGGDHTHDLLVGAITTLVTGADTDSDPRDQT